MGKTRTRLGAATAVVAWSLALPALAQQTANTGTLPIEPGAVAPPDARPVTSTVDAAVAGETKYPAAFFAPYFPVSAADMVARVPGFELREGDDRRGFGATAGNVLINGERPSSKTALSELLKRIPAASVVRLEILAGTNAASDVRGQSQIVNVVLNQASRQAHQTTYTLALRHIQYSDRIGWVTQASRTFTLFPNADLSVDAQIPNLLGRGETYDTLLTPAGVVTGTRAQIVRPDNIGFQGAAVLRWKPTPRDSVNLNAQFAPTWNSSDIYQAEANAAGALRNLLVGDTHYKNNATSEFGGDWEHRFSPKLSFKLIGVVSNGSIDQHDRFEIFTAPAVNLVRTQDRTTRNGERVGRARLRWSATPAHVLEFGVEGAFNFRDTTFDIVNQLRGGPAVPVPLPVADARVEELRGEAFVSDVWTVGPRLTVEAGFNFEASRITQTGDQQKERTLAYPKPRATATYALDQRNTFRGSVIRDVAQLDFAEFASAVDVLNNTSILGNPDLRPETAWKTRLEWESRFAARTALTVAGFADFVQDVHDLVAINGADAYGNIGSGTRIGAEVRFTAPLTVIGLPDAELRFNGLWQKTSVTDPITGDERSFSIPLERQGTPSGSPTLNAGNKDWAYLLNFRQNLPRWASSAGFTVVQWSGRAEYRLLQIDTYERPLPRIDAFFETTRIKPVTIRLSVSNIIPSAEDRTRTFFLGSRATRTVQRFERRDVLGGPEGSRVFGVQVSGRF